MLDARRSTRWQVLGLTPPDTGKSIYGAKKMRIMNFLLKAITVAAAIAYVASVVQAQTSCPFMACFGPAGDVWAVPLFLSVLGIPAVFLSMMFVGNWLWPKSPAVVVLKFIAIAMVIVPILGAALFGAIAGMHAARHPSDHSITH